MNNKDIKQVQELWSHRTVVFPALGHHSTAPKDPAEYISFRVLGFPSRVGFRAQQSSLNQSVVADFLVDFVFKLFTST